MWWLFFKSVLQGLAMIVIGELIRPKAKVESPKPSGLGDFNFPTAQDGRPIPVGWGTFKVKGANVTWYGDLETKPIKQKQKTGLFSSTKVTIGYKYFLGVEHSLCFGYIDEFIGLEFDDRAVTLTGFTTTADEFRFTMDSPTLYGKEKEQGGVTGPVRFYRGTFTQTANEYMRQKLGKAAIPAYRPVARAIFEHCYLGNSGNVQPPAFIVRRTPNPLGLTGGRHNLSGDANPANMLFEILTDKTWGLGRSASLIDTASFIQCGNTLAAEALGLSMLVDNVQNGWALMAEILRHIDGVVYQDFATGKFTMALVRDDYDAETAFELNESNIVPGSLEFGRASWEGTQNTVIVKYLDRAQKFTERTVQHQNLANVTARGGAIEAEEFEFLGFSNPAAANYVCGRVLRTVSAPLAKVELQANREATVLRPGSVFRLNWPSLGITSLVCRVTEIDYGTLDSPTVKITAAEDVFSVDDVAFDAPGGSEWVSPLAGPQPASPQAIIEAPRALYGDARMVLAMAQRAGGQEVGYFVDADPAGGTAYTEVADSPGFTPTATLVADYGASTHGLDASGFIVAAPKDIDDLEAVTATERAAGNALLLVDDEFMAYTGLTNNGDGTWTITGIQQGVLDTVPARHLAGARVWFVSGGAALALESPLGSDATVQIRLRPYTFRATLDGADATPMSLTTASRYLKPYPPAGVTVNGLYYRDAVIPGGTDLLALAWNHRDRLLQVDGSTVLQQDAASVGPEVGVTYTIKLYDETGVLRRTETGITADTYTWSTETADCVLPGDVAVLTFTGADGSTTLTDGAGSTWTATGNAQILSNALELDGSGDWASTPDKTDWQLNGPFCIELFGVTMDALSATHALAGHYDAYSPASNNRGWMVSAGADGKLSLSYSTGGTGVTATRTTAAAVFTVGVEVDIAISRDASGNLRFFVNGILTDTFTAQTWVSFNAASPLSIGAVNTLGSTTARNYVDGRIKAFRFTQGDSKYASDYIVPALPLVAQPRRLNVSGRVVIETWRDGVKSYQDHDFNWTRPGAALPIDVRVTNTGDVRVTNSGARRIVE